MPKIPTVQDCLFAEANCPVVVKSSTKLDERLGQVLRGPA